MTFKLRPGGGEEGSHEDTGGEVFRQRKESVQKPSVAGVAGRSEEHNKANLV